MRQPALSFRKAPSSHDAPCRRYIYGEVALGELNESFWSGTAVWRPADYKRQWRTAAQHCLELRVPVLFYKDVGPRASAAYHVVPIATGLLVFEQIRRGSHRPFTDDCAARALVRDRKRLSSWAAPVAALRSLVSAI